MILTCPEGNQKCSCLGDHQFRAVPELVSCKSHCRRRVPTEIQNNDALFVGIPSHKNNLESEVLLT